MSPKQAAGSFLVEIPLTTKEQAQLSEFIELKRATTSRVRPVGPNEVPGLPPIAAKLLLRLLEGSRMDGSQQSKETSHV